MKPLIFFRIYQTFTNLSGTKVAKPQIVGPSFQDILSNSLFHVQLSKKQPAIYIPYAFFLFSIFVTFIEKVGNSLSTECYAQTKRKLTKTFIHLLRPGAGGQRMQVLLLILHLHHLPLLPPLLLLHQVPPLLLPRLLRLVQAPEDLLEVLRQSHGRVVDWLGRKWDNSGLKTSSLRFLAFPHLLLHHPPARARSAPPPRHHHHSHHHQPSHQHAGHISHFFVYRVVGKLNLISGKTGCMMK